MCRQGAGYTRSSDMYSLSLVFYELFSFKIPYKLFPPYHLPTPLHQLSILKSQEYNGKPISIKIPNNTPNKIKLIMNLCFEKPKERISANESLNIINNWNENKVIDKLNSINKGK